MTGDFCSTRKKKSIGGVKSLALKQDELGRLQDKLSYSLSGMSEQEGRGAEADYGRPVNPISTMGGKLCTPI